MNKNQSIKLLLLALFFALSNSLFAQNQAKIYHFTLNQEIDRAAYRLVKKAVREAEAQKADYIVMTLNTYGGMLDAADSIRTILMQAKPITVVFINNNAASAGALISIACDSIYMIDGANIGAATVVDQNGEKQIDKYQSYMRGLMRSTAETNHRNPIIAEAMVDERIVVPGKNDSIQILTFTSKEAIQNNYCEGVVKNEKEVYAKLSASTKVIEHQVTLIDKLVGFLLNPFVNSILILMIFGGIYFELKMPGIGLPTVIAILGAILYFAPLYLDGLAANWEILLFFIGLILIALEIFVIPGFGVVGILGIVCVLLGLILSLINNDFFTFPNGIMETIGYTLFRVTITLIIGIPLAAAFGGSIFNFPVFKKMVLLDDQKSNKGYSIKQSEQVDVIGLEGIVISDCRPSGKVEIEGNLYDAISDAEYILKGTKIIVTKVQGYSVKVKKA